MQVAECRNGFRHFILDVIGTSFALIKVRVNSMVGAMGLNGF
jgi:hypothetical protein